MTHLRGIDPALIALLVLTAAAGVVWTLAIPPYQQPDEPDHFVYVDNLARDWDASVDGRYSEATWRSVVVSKASAVAHHDRSIGEAGSEAAERVKADVRSASRARYREGGEGSLRGDVGVEVEYSRAVGYPPGYYGLAAAALSTRHALGDDDDVFGDLYVARLVSVIMGVITVLLAWFAYGWTFGSGTARLVATGLVALLPMPAFLRSGVNADVLVTLLVSAAFLLAVRSVNSDRGMTVRIAVLAGIVLGAGLLTKQTFAIVVFGWLGVVLLETARRRLTIRAAALRAALTCTVLALCAGWFFAASSQVGVTNDVSAGSASLLDPIDYLRRISSERWRDQVNEWWGVYGWLDTTVSMSWYRLLAVLTILTVSVGVVGAIRAARRRKVDWAVIVSVAWVSLWAIGLAWVEYNLMRTGKSGPFVQGRYYMPVLIPTIHLLVAAWRWLGSTGRIPWERAAVAVLPFAAAYHLITLIQFVIPRYYV